jgi:hypothetical protein
MNHAGRDPEAAHTVGPRRRDDPAPDLTDDRLTSDAKGELVGHALARDDARLESELLRERGRLRTAAMTHDESPPTSDERRHVSKHAR